MTVNYWKLSNFIDQLPESQLDQFKAGIREGELVGKTALKSAFSAADTVTQSISTVVVMWLCRGYIFQTSLKS